MHGGAEGSGAPKGNQNALKHGVYTREALKSRAVLRGYIREAESLLKDLAKDYQAAEKGFWACSTQF
jgi:uncharacterized protein YjcR